MAMVVNVLDAGTLRRAFLAYQVEPLLWIPVGVGVDGQPGIAPGQVRVNLMWRVMRMIVGHVRGNK
jgi:hypothetical protein